MTPIQFRQHLGLTVPRTADLLGVSVSSWRDYERGTTALPKYVKASMAFAVKLHDRGEL